MEQVEIFCDGSCLGNPGPGGWGAIIRLGNKEENLSGGKNQTTNNAMELTAALESLKSIEVPAKITVTTDSQYLVKGMTEWMPNWIRNNWRTAAKKPVKNRELWESLKIEADRHDIAWKWVRGHEGHRENELCDKMAVAEANRHR